MLAKKRQQKSPEWSKVFKTLWKVLSVYLSIIRWKGSFEASEKVRCVLEEQRRKMFLQRLQSHIRRTGHMNPSCEKRNVKYSGLLAWIPPFAICSFLCSLVGGCNGRNTKSRISIGANVMTFKGTSTFWFLQNLNASQALRTSGTCGPYR